MGDLLTTGSVLAALILAAVFIYASLRSTLHHAQTHSSAEDQAALSCHEDNSDAPSTHK